MKNQYFQFFLRHWFLNLWRLINIWIWYLELAFIPLWLIRKKESDQIKIRKIILKLWVFELIWGKTFCSSLAKILKNHHFWPKFKKSSFLPKWKIIIFCQILKNHLFGKNLKKNINFGCKLKNHHFLQNLKNHPFLLKFENSSFYSKIWKISSVVSVLPTLEHWKDTGVFSVVVSFQCLFGPST